MLEAFPTRAHPSTAVSPLQVKVAVQNASICTMPSSWGSEPARPIDHQWDADDPSSAPGKFWLMFAASCVLQLTSCGTRDGAGVAPSHALASAGPAPGAHQSKTTEAYLTKHLLSILFNNCFNTKMH